MVAKLNDGKVQQTLILGGGYKGGYCKSDGVGCPLHLVSLLYLTKYFHWMVIVPEFPLSS